MFDFKTIKGSESVEKGKYASCVSSEFTILLKKQDEVLSEFLEIECTHITLNYVFQIDLAQGGPESHENSYPMKSEFDGHAC